MKFSHSFVVARLLPEESARWTSSTGRFVAEQLQTRPFVALRVHWLGEMGVREDGITYPYGDRGLFVVSREKPRAPFQNFYLPLAPGNDEKEPLILNHLLTDHGPLYLHLFPAIIERYQVAAREQPIEASYHQLDPVSFKRFASFFKNTRPPRIPVPESGGDEEVQSSWSTFSGQPKFEDKRPQKGFVFDFGPFSSDVLDNPTNIYEELVLLEKLSKEYSWQRVSSTIDWLRRLRDANQDRDTFSIGDYAYDGNLPELSDIHSRFLVGVKIPFDGEPLSEDPTEDKDPWGEDPTPEFAFVLPQDTIIPQKDIKVVALDICSILFDRPKAVRLAVQKLGIQVGNIHDLGLEQHLRELEALQYKTHGGTYEQVARQSLHALLAFASLLPIDDANLRIEAAVGALLHPPLVPGAQLCLTALKASGFFVIGYSAIDAPTFNEHLRPSIIDLPLETVLSSSDSSGLFSDCSWHMQRIMDLARERHAQISPEQILVVSSSSVRALEPATAQGMAMALLMNMEDPEVSCLDCVHTFMSTMVMSSLDDLPGLIHNPSLCKRSNVAGRNMWSQNLRVIDIYQLDSVLGSSGDTTVNRAVNWLNGEIVAVKVAMPQPWGSMILYEAQVYKQLAGSRTIPSIHWSGTNGGADVLIMDCLGPTLEHLMLACRGSLTLKSVLMIGLQILEFVEFAHSRGIILRDIKPSNFAVGRAPNPDKPTTVFAFDFGLAKLYVDPIEKKHIPLRTGRRICGTVRYSSHWSHLGLESSRRDDIVVLGHTLLRLLHGKLPWEGIYASSIEAKLERIGDMKTPANTLKLLSQSPAVLLDFMVHGYSLGFEQKPDYKMLRGLLEETIRKNGWNYDGLFDWIEPSLAPRGTLLPKEYVFLLDQNMAPESMRLSSG